MGQELKTDANGAFHSRQALLADPRPGHDEALLLLDVVFAFTVHRRSRLRLHGFNVVGLHGPHPLCRGARERGALHLGPRRRHWMRTSKRASMWYGAPFSAAAVPELIGWGVAT